MIKKLFLMLPVTALILTSCSNDTPVMSDNSGTGEECIANNFLTISINPNNNSGAKGVRRAPDTPPTGEYVDGDASEGKVNNIRFYFFSDDGNPTAVWVNNGTGTGYRSYIDWYPESDFENTGNTNESVEKTLTTTLGLNIPGGYDKPELVLAVINPTQDILALQPVTGTGSTALTGPSLEALQNIVADYHTDLHSSNFVMSNSVYAKEGEAVYAQEIDTTEGTGNFASTPEDAAKKPLTIFVERVLARLDFGITIQGGITVGDNVIYPTKAPAVGSDASGGTINVGNGTSTEPMEIYVKFLNWDIVSTPDASRLIKDVNPSWPENMFADASAGSWNLPAYFRSFWAYNPAANRFQYIYHSYNQMVGVEGSEGVEAISPAYAIPNPVNSEGETNYVTAYLQENASPLPASDASVTLEAPASPTQVVIAAQLVNKNGQPVSLAEYNYNKYTDTGLLTYLVNSKFQNVYKKTTTGTAGNGTVTWTKISPDDLTFATAAQLLDNTGFGVTAPSTNPEYYSYVVVKTEDADGKPNGNASVTWTIGKEDAAVAIGGNGSLTDMNKYIMDEVDHVMVWNSGMTYYFINVRHLGAQGTAAYEGIVRNHIYQTDIKSVAGLGTPVYDPDQVIIPTKPNYNESILEAQVKVLQWRIVSEDYDLVW